MKTLGIYVAIILATIHGVIAVNVPVPVIKICVEVPSTPALNKRLSNDWPSPENLTFCSEINSMPDLNAPFPQNHFDAPNALVLIKNNLASMTVNAIADTNETVKLKIVRDPADSTTVGTGGFTILPNPSTNSGAISTDSRGSFYIVGWIDSNNNNILDSMEHYGVLPIIIVDVNLAAEDSIFRPEKIAYYPDDVEQAVFIETGEYNYADRTRAGAHFQAWVDFVGGGSDGKRGTDRVWAGWCHNLTDQDARADYTNGRKAVCVNATNVPASRYFSLNDPDPNHVAMPILDHGQSVPPIPVAQGGRTICLHWDPAFGFNQIVDEFDSPIFGLRKQIEEIDSPWQSYLYRHNGYPAETIEGATFKLNFNAWLVCWSNIVDDPAAPGNAGERTYNVIMKQSWKIDTDFTVSLTADVSAPGDFNGAIFPAGVLSLSSTNFAEYSPVKRPGENGINCETRPPELLPLLGIDYKN